MKYITALCILGVTLSVVGAADAVENNTEASKASEKESSTEPKNEEPDAASDESSSETADGWPPRGVEDPSEFIRKLIQSAVKKMTEDAKKNIQVIPLSLAVRERVTNCVSGAGRFDDIAGATTTRTPACAYNNTTTSTTTTTAAIASRIQMILIRILAAPVAAGVAGAEATDEMAAGRATFAAGGCLVGVEGSFLPPPSAGEDDDDDLLRRKKYRPLFLLVGFAVFGDSAPSTVLAGSPPPFTVVPLSEDDPLCWVAVVGVVVVAGTGLVGDVCVCGTMEEEDEVMVVDVEVLMLSVGSASPLVRWPTTAPLEDSFRLSVCFANSSSVGVDAGGLLLFAAVTPLEPSPSEPGSTATSADERCSMTARTSVIWLAPPLTLPTFIPPYRGIGASGLSGLAIRVQLSTLMNTSFPSSVFSLMHMCGWGGFLNVLEARDRLCSSSSTTTTNAPDWLCVAARRVGRQQLVCGGAEQYRLPLFYAGRCKWLPGHRAASFSDR
uniref:Uncharacterized protein n=1 Tax=Anopheles atroparvus TaxID=41427 RepID=A0A182INI3_ANOAO